MSISRCRVRHSPAWTNQAEKNLGCRAEALNLTGNALLSGAIQRFGCGALLLKAMNTAIQYFPGSYPPTRASSVRYECLPKQCGERPFLGPDLETVHVANEHWEEKEDQRVCEEERPCGEDQRKAKSIEFLVTV
jgi:hypothetical protein